MLKGVRHIIQETGSFNFGKVKIEGLLSYHDDARGRKRSKNIIYKWHISGISIAHMGDYGEPCLSFEQQEFLKGIDVLLLPVGGVYTIDGQKAAKIIEELRPRIAIPMHYKTDYCKLGINDITAFL